MKRFHPTLNKTFHIVIIVTVLTIYGLLTWVVDVRTSDFVDHQSSEAQKVAASTALEISTYIQNRRNLLTVLNKSYLKELVEIKKDPANPIIRDTIRQKMQLIFPEMLEFTLVSPDGKIILPKTSDFVVGNSCKGNIAAFSRGHLSAVVIHGNPNPQNYHFDILSHIDFPNQNNIILFMSLNTSVIEDILKKRPQTGHSFFLIKGSESRFIEISAEGNLGTITHNKQLTESEASLINANIKVNGTSWNLISIINPSAINQFSAQINQQKTTIFSLCILAGIIVSFLFFRTDKKRLNAERDILNQNSILEEKVTARTQELSYRATHDQLTKLINRGEFERRLTEALSLTKSDHVQSVLMYLDLDQFKIVNDTAGHAAGDELLKQVTSLLKSQLRRGDTLARLGGDEFGILLNHCDIDRASIIAEQLRVVVHNYHFEWESYSFTIGTSIGIIAMNEDSPQLSELMSLVDAACYMAKDLGRNQYYIYDTEDTAFEEKHSAMYRAEMALTAIKDKNLELHGQKITGISSLEDSQHWYEVLVRIKHESGLIYPDNFIPALEQFGRITTLDTAIIKQSIAFLGTRPNFKFSINLSGLSIVKPEIISTIKQTLKKNNVNPARVCFEITETAAIGNLGKVTAFINAIHKIGSSVALDDFGTGMSSFSYLSNLDVDYIKLDGSFVRDIGSNIIHHTMVDSINSIVNIMGKFVIAEYVENEDVYEQLKKIGISHGQGYFIHRPEKLDDIANA